MPIVLKIGGSNLHNAESLRRIVRVVRQYNKPVILVVSAFNGLTDRLYEVIREEKKNEEVIVSFLDEISQRFEEIIVSELKIGRAHV